MNARLFACCAAFCLMVATLFADGAADVRRHMEQRLPMIDGLKARQIIGENNRGYVETRQPGTAQDSAILADENRDRETVYALIAQQTGALEDGDHAIDLAINRRGLHVLAGNPVQLGRVEARRRIVWIAQRSGARTTESTLVARERRVSNRISQVLRLEKKYIL